MEVGENRVRIFHGTEKREKKKDSRYIQEASAPAAVTVYQTCNIMYICNNVVTGVLVLETCYKCDTRSLLQGLMPPVYISSLSLSLFSVSLSMHMVLSI
jgi:hypothetical protein